MKKISGFDYCINELGEIFSLKTKKTIKDYDHSGGYRIVHLRKNGERKAKYVHRIVLETFVGKRSKKYVANHKNFDRKDNRLSNLEWTTQKDNVRHALDNFRNPLHKSLILEKEIMRMFGVNRVAVIAKKLKVSVDVVRNCLRRNYSSETIKAVSLILRTKRKRNFKGQYI